MNRYNESYFIDENSNILNRFACKNDLPSETLKYLSEGQLINEAKWQMQFPSEMTAVLLESTKGNSTVLEIKWKNTKPGMFLVLSHLDMFRVNTYWSMLVLHTIYNIF